MNPYIVNPPIEDDLDYYRQDTDVVERVFSGKSVLCVGLRRSGKTSFLYRIRREASRLGVPTYFLDLGGISVDQGREPTVCNEIAKVSSNSKGIVLLDEAEAFLPKDEALLARILARCGNSPVVLTCAPVFIRELGAYSSVVHTFVEKCVRHVTGALTDEEALLLLRQAKRYSAPPFSEEAIQAVLRSGERLPIVLQAIGAKHVAGEEVSVTLNLLGSRILSGLTAEAQKALVQMALGETPKISPGELRMLVSVGALRCDSPGSGQEPRVAFASEILAERIKQSASASMSSAVGAEQEKKPTPWSTHARILHLSDLHIGPKCVESLESVNILLKRLTDALEKFDIVPDFVAVTGDLSWSGKPTELKAAEKFLVGLAEWLAQKSKCSCQQARDRFLIVPGNHESAWTLSGGLGSKDDDEFLGFSSAPYANLVNRFHEGRAFWDLEMPCTVRTFPAFSICFLAISTAHSITKKAKDGQFGSHVRDEVLRILSQQEVQKAQFRVGLVHHNWAPCDGHNKGPKDIVQVGHAFAKCSSRFDLILHGHVHLGAVGLYQPQGRLAPIPYSSVGSFGVRAKNRPGNSIIGKVPNQFSVVELQTAGSDRRFTTQFYEHEYTATGDVEWKLGKKEDPLLMG